MFLLVPAYPGCPGSKAVKRSLFSTATCHMSVVKLCYALHNELINKNNLLVTSMRNFCDGCRQFFLGNLPVKE